jgi:uncharacterized membrane protein (UPF0127 family)
MSSFLSPLARSPKDYWRLRNTRTGGVVADRLEGAFDSKTRKRGLLGRTGLESDTALILAPCNAVHMFFMRFAIDVAFVSRKGDVVKVVKNLRPWRLAVAWRAHAAVELAAGALDATGTTRGDRLALER